MNSLYLNFSEILFKSVFFLRKEITKLLKDENLTLSDFFTLKTLAHNDNINIKKIADFLPFNGLNMTQVIDSLEEKKLVRRIYSSKDRREILIEITDDGRKFYEKINAKYCRLLENFFSKIPTQDIEKTNNHLKKIFSEN